MFLEGNLIPKSDPPPPHKPGNFQELCPPPGAFNYLKENFSNAPSLDMSAASLTMLVRLMVAQVQECVFEKMTLLRAQNDFLARLQLAQEAARVRILGRRGFCGLHNLPGGHNLLSPSPEGHPSSQLFSLPSSQVEDVYSLVHQTMSQPHVKDYVPFSWTTMVHVKSEHFKALSHYFAAIALCDCPGECPAHPSVDSWILGGIPTQR